MPVPKEESEKNHSSVTLLLIVPADCVASNTAEETEFSL